MPLKVANLSVFVLLSVHTATAAATARRRTTRTRSCFAACSGVRRRRRRFVLFGRTLGGAAASHFKGQQSGNAESSRSSRHPNPCVLSGDRARWLERPPLQPDDFPNNPDKGGVRCVRLSSIKRSHVSELERTVWGGGGGEEGGVRQRVGFFVLLLCSGIPLCRRSCIASLLLLI